MTPVGRPGTVLVPGLLDGPDVGHGYAVRPGDDQRGSCRIGPARRSGDHMPGTADADRTDLLAGLPEQVRIELFDRGRRADFDRDDLLIREGTKAVEIGVLLDGRVRVTTLAATGREVLLAIRQPGEPIGELGVLDGAPRSASVYALEHVTVLFVPAAVFRDAMRRVPGLSVAVAQATTRRLRESNRRLVEQVADDMLTRLSRRLLEVGATHCRIAGEALELTMPLSQEQLAQWIGATREATAKGLSELRAQGMIDTGRMKIRLLDIGGLRQLADV